MNINTIHNSYSPAVVQPGSAHNVKTQNKTGPDNQNTQSKKQEISSKFVEEHQDEFTKNEKIIIAELKQVDQAVKRHEMAHVVAGGRFILSGANYSYKTGPDGKRYAVAGEVSIDTSEVPGDPQATIDKMHQVRRAALAPADPSAQDRQVASTAMTISTKAMSQLMLDRIKFKTESDEEKAFGNIKQTADNAYIKIKNMPYNQKEPAFKISA